MKIRILDATNTQLNYLVAKLKNHEWHYPWLLEESGFVSWQSNEESWGNPTPIIVQMGLNSSKKNAIHFTNQVLVGTQLLGLKMSMIILLLVD